MGQAVKVLQGKRAEETAGQAVIHCALWPFLCRAAVVGVCVCVGRVFEVGHIVWMRRRKWSGRGEWEPAVVTAQGGLQTHTHIHKHTKCEPAAYLVPLSEISMHIR